MLVAYSKVCNITHCDRQCDLYHCIIENEAEPEYWNNPKNDTNTYTGQTKNE